jgi:hypothetical protein
MQAGRQTDTKKRRSTANAPNYWKTPCKARPCRLRLKCDGKRAENRFRLSAKRTSPFKLAGESVQSTVGRRGVRISGSNAGYTMFRGSVKSIGYPLHSPVSPSLPFPCVTVCHHISTELYHLVYHKSQTDAAWQADDWWPEPCHGLKTALITNYTPRFRAYLTENTVRVHYEHESIIAD